MERLKYCVDGLVPYESWSEEKLFQPTKDNETKLRENGGDEDMISIFMRVCGFFCDIHNGCDTDQVHEHFQPMGLYSVCIGSTLNVSATNDMTASDKLSNGMKSSKVKSPKKWERKQVEHFMFDHVCNVSSVSMIQLSLNLLESV